LKRDLFQISFKISVPTSDEVYLMSYIGYNAQSVNVC